MSASEDAKEKVRQNLLVFVEVAESLIEIRDKRLWRESYPGFREYVEARFGEKAEYALDVLEIYERWIGE